MKNKPNYIRSALKKNVQGTDTIQKLIHLHMQSCVHILNCLPNEGGQQFQPIGWARAIFSGVWLAVIDVCTIWW